MWPCYKFPYSQMQDLNLDWVIEKIRELEEAIKHVEVPDELKEELEALKKTVGALSISVITLKETVANHEERIKELEASSGQIKTASLNPVVASFGFEKVETQTTATGTFQSIDV